MWCLLTPLSNYFPKLFFTTPVYICTYLNILFYRIAIALVYVLCVYQCKLFVNSYSYKYFFIDFKWLIDLFVKPVMAVQLPHMNLTVILCIALPKNHMPAYIYICQVYLTYQPTAILLQLILCVANWKIVIADHLDIWLSRYISVLFAFIRR